MMKAWNNFFGTDFLKKLGNWHSAFSHLPFKGSSTGFCGLSLSADKIFLTHIIPHEEKPALVLGKQFSYKKKEELQEILSKAVNDYGLRDLNCYWILRPDQYQLLQTESLPVPDNEFQAAIRWKIKSLLPFAVEDAVIDHFAMPPLKSAMAPKMIMLVIAKSSFLKPLSEVIEASGLKLSTIDIPELCLRNLISLEEPADKSTALIFFHEKNSQLLIAQNQQFYFSRQLDCGSEMIEASASQEQLNPILDKLALDLQRSFDFFQSQWRQTEPGCLLLANKPSLELGPLLSKRLNIPAKTLSLSDYFTLAQDNELTPEELLPLLGGALRERKISHAPAEH